MDQIIEVTLTGFALCLDPNHGFFRQGPVPELLVDNQAASFVLFLEGEELRGAKQNRVLSTSVLIAASTKAKIPVSCVEQGRWRAISSQEMRRSSIAWRCSTLCRCCLSPERSARRAPN